MFELHRKYVVEPTGDWFLEKIGATMANVGSSLWNWFVHAIPDIAGYGMMASGAVIVLGSLSGRGGIAKPLTYLVGGLIVAVCILEVA